MKYNLFFGFELFLSLIIDRYNGYDSTKTGEHKHQILFFFFFVNNFSNLALI